MNPETPRPAPRRLRRWALVVGIIVVVMVAFVALLPRLLSTRAGNRLIAGQLARAFAPGRLRVDSIRLSWTAPTRLVGVVLDDPTGKTVVSAPAASITASLWGLVVHPDQPGTLALQQATFAIERHEDGRIDLAEALSGIFAGRDPLRDLAIRADGAAVTYRAPALARPLVAEAMDLLVQLRPSPNADTWSIDLRRAEGSSLRIRGELDRWKSRANSEGMPELGLTCAIVRWPFALNVAGSELSATLDGDLSVGRHEGRWTSGGTLKARGLEAAGRKFEEVASGLAAEWNVAVGRDGWSVDRLELTGGVGRVSAVVPDLADASRPARIEADLDLAPVVRMLARDGDLGGPASVEAGKVRLVAVSRPGGDRAEWTLTADLSDLAWKDASGALRRESNPVNLAGRATYRPDGRRLDVAEFALTTKYGSLRAGGQLSGLGADPLSAELTGTIAPNWEAVAKVLTDRVDPHAKLVGRAAPFRLKVAPGRGLEADLGVELIEADLFGMRLGPTPVSAHYRDERLSFDPIESTINGGRLHLEPVVQLDAAGGPLLRLGRGSVLADAAVNEEVSSRVLAYVAPVLDRTARASGRVSASIDEASIPIGGDAGRKASVTGKVVFQDVEFAPSPFAREMVGMVAPRRELGSLRIDQPVQLTIADGRVNQRGLAIPIGDLTRVEVEGWVDFDKNLSLVATLPVTPAMLGDTPVLGDLIAGTKVRVPIGGTLAAPKLDKAAFNAGLKDLGKNLLVRGAGVGAAELLERLTRPRDPNAPPPPTAEERKAHRLERRNDRRRARGLEPLPGPDEQP